jgi:hypothetical protein
MVNCDPILFVPLSKNLTAVFRNFFPILAKPYIMKRIFIALTLCLSLLHFSSSAQKPDSVSYFKHTIGVDVLQLTRIAFSGIYTGGVGDVTLDVFYRHQLNKKWGINTGITYRERSGSMRLNKVEWSSGEGYCFRLGPVYHTVGEDAHLTFGVNAVGSFLNDNIRLKPGYTAGDYTNDYNIKRKRFGAEAEIALEQGLAKRGSARIVLRGGYAPTMIDNDGLKGLAFPGVYNWFESYDYYFYVTLFAFVRGGRR